MGIKADVKKTWKVLLYAVGCSVLISLLSLFVYLPIYYNPDNADVLEIVNGRLINSNASFGVIGLYLLLDRKKRWYNQGKLVKYISILSIIAVVLTFNRTYLGLCAIEFIWLSYQKFSLRNFSKIVILPVLLIGIIIFAYSNSSIIKRQIDQRFLSILKGNTTIAEAVIENNRDAIYQGIQTRINEGYWAIGLPFEKEIFISAGIEKIKMDITDTSVMNILLRFGIIPLILVIIIFLKLYKFDKEHAYRTAFLIYVAASLNTDSLFRQNSVFFLIILFLVSNFKVNESHDFKKLI